MHSIFSKLFFSFWLATILSGVVFFLLAFNLRLAPLHEEHRRRWDAERAGFMSEVLTIYGTASVASYEKNGKLPPPPTIPPKATGAPGPAHHLQAFFFKADGSALSSEVPPQIRDAVQRQLGAPGAATAPGRGALVLPITGPSGARYLVASESGTGPGPGNAPPPHFPRPFPPEFWLQMLITFVVSGAVCYGLSWRLTAPVRRLRSATQELANGNLATRVAVKSKGRGDEIVDLGNDFNQMASRLEKLVNAHRQLLRDVSHELRSPLARMNVALEIARQKSPESAEPPLQRIQQEGERLDQLIGELLALSRLDGDAGTERSEVDLAELAAEVVQDADFEACASNRHVEYLPTEGIMVLGNRELLRRALENVVRNAVRYTAVGSSVQVALQRTPGQQALVRVKDFGPGVPEEQLSDIFRPFYRVAEARDRQSGGTGIGLAITERTVALHGGSVAARNLPEAGLEVEIRLPLVSRN
ncbi:two-component sensor histidine kinase [Geomonas silvestris]|uniref:histidine kinase n=1 Tax=Geomonas silvestris TaxID=2740184 RepID=A0A6V8MJV8_9BACT|nr:ATP-binding protein [Geomonas silvestris]GFO59979.1 two-component sensor histidine kinase [Geomonas silvestris]